MTPAREPRVLIVDDSVTVRMDLKEALEEGGFATELAATLAEARGCLARGGVGAVILDLLLPDGDGLAFLAELKAAPQAGRPPVMLLSSEGEVADRVRGLRTGADEYLGKPYDRAQVVSRIREMLRRGRAADRERPLVLVIDDSPTFRDVLRGTLEAGGYDAAEAATGEDGLRRAADLRPDAVIVDGVLPGMDGVEVIRRIRSDPDLRRAPCLLLTASLGRAEELRALEAGADLFVFKDEDMELVLGKLGALLRPGPAAARGEDPSLLGAKRILAVDRDRAYRDGLADRLRQAGYDVVAAETCQEAMDLLAVQPVDAVLLDAAPPSLEGLETCRRIRARPDGGDITLLLLSAREEKEDLLRGIQAGADDFLAKAGRFEVLEARLKARLRRSRFSLEERRAREDLRRRELEAIEARAARELAEARAAHIAELERANGDLRRAKAEAEALARELETFSYSVSHDLRAPLRGIDGFSAMLQERHGGELGEEAARLLGLVRKAAAKMGELIEDMLGLARVTRAGLSPETLDLSAMAAEAVEDLRRRDPDRAVAVDIEPGLEARGDRGLVRILLANLLGNAWKFTSRTDAARIVFACEPEDGHPVFVVRDNGAGFDMAYADRLFGAFQRLHRAEDFPGTGVGLATVERVVRRHGGRIRAEGRPGAGAAFRFTLAPGPDAGSPPA